MSNSSDKPLIRLPSQQPHLVAARRALLDARRISFPDLEMNGTRPDIHRIIQVGGVLANFPGLQFASWFERKVKPGPLKDSDWFALRKIVCYSSARWQDAVGIRTALHLVERLMSNSIVAWWDGSLDMRFLQATWQRMDWRPPNAVAFLDLQKWAQDRLQFDQRPGLQAVADMLKIPRARKHDALEDSLASAHIFRMFWQYSALELEELVPQLDPERTPDIGPIFLSRQLRAERLEEILPYLSIDFPLPTPIIPASRRVQQATSALAPEAAKAI